MRYRICKMTNGNNRIWYKIQEKKWWHWNWKDIKIYNRGYYEILSFVSFEKAKEWVDVEIANNDWIKKAKQEKVLERVEI